MRKYYYLYIILILYSFFLLSLKCHSPSSPENENSSSELVTLNGQVINQANYSPLDSAVVRIIDEMTDVLQLTDSLGQYKLQFYADTTFTLRIVAFKESFVPDTAEILAVPGRTILVPSLSNAKSSSRNFKALANRSLSSDSQ